MRTAVLTARIRRSAWIVVSLGFGAVSCELDEIVVPEGDPLVLVQGVMRPDLDRQWILVEQSLTGEPRGSSGPFIPNDPPDLPIEGALVTVTNTSRDPVTDPCGGSVRFVEAATPLGSATPGLYWAPEACPTMGAGDSLELRVEFNGTVVTGGTEVPGASTMVLRAGGVSVQIPGPTLELNRDTDTLVAEISATHGRALQLELRPQSPFAASGSFMPRHSTTFWVDSTALTIPGDFVDIFEVDFDDDFVPDLFIAGQYYDVTLALTDQNFFDFLRSANSPLSGRGFINRLEGGFGLFGSLTAATNALAVIATVDDPREGVYRMSGTVDGVDVDLELELYVGRTLRGRELFSAFARGSWVHGPLDHTSGGELAGQQMFAFLEQVIPDSVAPGPVPFVDGFRFSGRLDDSGTFPVTVTDATRASERGTLTGVKVR